MTTQVARQNVRQFSSCQRFKRTKKCYTNTFVIRVVNTYIQTAKESSQRVVLSQSIERSYVIIKLLQTQHALLYIAL